MEIFAKNGRRRRRFLCDYHNILRIFKFQKMLLESSIQGWNKVERGGGGGREGGSKDS